MARENKNSINCISSVNTQWARYRIINLSFIHSHCEALRGKRIQTLYDAVVQNKACPPRHRREGSNVDYLYDVDVTI